MFGLGLVGKGVKAIATGRTQASLGAQSAQLPSAVTRLGRFAYVVSGAWLGIAWYSGYVNMRTVPGGGPRLVLPGHPVINTRPDRALPRARWAISRNGSGSSVTSVPANEIITGGARLAIAQAANSSVGRGGFVYAEVRPYPHSLNSRPCRTDCSGFATLCYKAAGVPDPNGLGYNGTGNTSTLEAHGVPVGTPNIGDLAFWASPDHVAVVVGPGPDPVIVSFGSPPGPIRLTVRTESPFHASFLGYRSYGVPNIKRSSQLPARSRTNADGTTSMRPGVLSRSAPAGLRRVPR